MKHKIYLLWDNGKQDHSEYDVYYSHVVIADSQAEARELCPFADEGDIWKEKELSECKCIGKSNNKKEVVLSSFNAG